MKSFIQFLLGNVIKCEDVGQLRQCKIGVTADCLLYQNFQLRRLNPENYTRRAFIGEKSMRKRQKELQERLDGLNRSREEYEMCIRDRHHGPGTDGFKGYDSTTHTDKKLDCSHEGEVTGYEMSCGETDGAEVAVLTVRPDTTQWTREVKLQAGYEIKGSIAVASDSFIWNGGAPSAQNELSVESNGTYTCRLNAGVNNTSAEASVSVAVNNIDRRGPEITELTYAGDWTGGGVEVTVKAQDLQENGAPGCGIAEAGYSFDGGGTWKENVHTFTENGIYLIKVRDKLGNEGEKSLVINTIDNTAPKIHIDWSTAANVRVNRVTVKAEDLQPEGGAGSGLAEEPFSFDGGKTWGKSSQIDIRENGTVTVAVRDKTGNIAKQTIDIQNIDKMCIRDSS